MEYPKKIYFTLAKRAVEYMIFAALDIKEDDSDIEYRRADVIYCPFCNDDDFDLPGLKYHLNTHCKKYNAIEKIQQVGNQM